MIPVSRQNILVILNPASGVVSKDVAASTVFRTLRGQFHTVGIINSQSPEHAGEIVRSSLPYFHIITAFGGDGTINSVARGLLGTRKTLGILPGGSGNGLVRNLGIPLSWKKALEVLIHGEDQAVDIGTVNDRPFFNVAGIGLDGLISKKFEEEARGRGITPYIYHAFKGYFEMEPYHIRIRQGDDVSEETIMLSAFANFPQYGGKAIIAPFADPRDGRLDLCLVSKFKLLQGTRNIQRLFNGNIHKFPFYKTRAFEEIEVESLSGPIPLTIDGEYGGDDATTFRVKAHPQAITVRVPSPRV